MPGASDRLHAILDPGAYDRQARKLAGMFAENFTAYSDRVGAEVLAAAPTGM